MVPLAEAVRALAPCDFALFVVGSAVVFDSHHLSWRSYLGAATFVLAAALALGGFWAAPAAEPARLGVATLLLLVAAGVFVAAAASRGQRRLPALYVRARPPTLLTKGIYRSVRHPFYLAYLLTFAALAQASDHVAALIALALGALVYGSAAVSEERAFMRSRQAAAYRKYCRTAGMFWPRWSFFCR